ncbi:MAG: hypothetical protein ACRENE_28975 [Polyangiaceae bacterium]
MSSSNPSAGPSFDAFESDLLRAGRTRTAPAAARAQAVRAARATSAGVSGAPGPRDTGAAPGSVTGGAGVMKLAGLACAGSASIVAALWAAGALHALQPTAQVASPGPPPAIAALPAPHAAPAAPSATVQPIVPAPVWAVDDLPVASAQPAPRVVASARSTASGEDSWLSLEIALLDRIRAATASGEPARALRLLDEYGTRFPVGVMASEAAVLRIEATGATGDRAGARRLARAFRAEHPQNPYAARIASVVGADL